MGNFALVAKRIATTWFNNLQFIGYDTAAEITSAWSSLILTSFTGPGLQSCPRRQFNIKRWFLPQGKDLLLMPVRRVLTKFHVKIPKHSYHNGPHFSVCHILSQSLAIDNHGKKATYLPQACSIANRKWLRGSEIIIRKACIPKPPFWHERLCILEIAC
jgi:hypothetical protein